MASWFISQMSMSLEWKKVKSADLTYRKISNIKRTKFYNLKCSSCRLAVVFAQSIEAMY